MKILKAITRVINIFLKSREAFERSVAWLDFCLKAFVVFLAALGTFLEVLELFLVLLVAYVALGAFFVVLEVFLFSLVGALNCFCSEQALPFSKS